jgi:CheY-like chemotaxis protein
MKQLTVLVVEDSKPMQAILIKILEDFGFGTVLTAEDGEQAYQIHQHHRPDIIITDWHMEPVDGLELCHWIRRNKHSVNRTVPIILMTGDSGHIKINNARDKGVTEILVKPFNARDLARRLMHVIDMPRDFIEAQEFFGPDRRRHSDDNFEGKNKRLRDPEDV